MDLAQFLEPGMRSVFLFPYFFGVVLWVVYHFKRIDQKYPSRQTRFKLFTAKSEVEK